VLRTALRPRWLALLVVVLVASSAMALLGQWQLNRAREHRREPAERAERAREQAAPKPVEQVIAPRQTFPRDGVNTRVSVTGDWDPAHRLLVTGRDLAGRKGFWVLVPLRRADGSAVPVVRGWVASPSDPAAAGPVGNGVRVIGLLQPSEPPSQRGPGETSGLPADQVDRVSAAELVNVWPYPLITGFVVEQSQTPATGPAPSLLPAPTSDPGLDLQNLSYAIQWWLFAGFGLFFWYRLVRDDHRGELAQRPGGGPKPGDEPHLDTDVPDDVSSLISVDEQNNPQR
jgi:cytochrome oxidase assembly protein ShyY1